MVRGSQALSDSQGRCVQQYGGEICTNALVRRVLMSGRVVGVELADGEQIMARKAIVGCIHPHVLGNMVEGLDPQMVEEAKRCELSRFGALNTHWALHEAANYKCSEI